MRFAARRRIHGNDLWTNIAKLISAQGFAAAEEQAVDQRHHIRVTETFDHFGARPKTEYMVEPQGNIAIPPYAPMKLI